jgi:hypothetical protein
MTRTPSPPGGVENVPCMTFQPVDPEKWPSGKTGETLSRHRRMTEFKPDPDIGRRETPQRTKVRPY